MVFFISMEPILQNTDPLMSYYFVLVGNSTRKFGLTFSYKSKGENRRLGILIKYSVNCIPISSSIVVNVLKIHRWQRWNLSGQIAVLNFNRWKVKHSKNDSESWQMEPESRGSDTYRCDCDKSRAQSISGAWEKSYMCVLQEGGEAWKETDPLDFIWAMVDHSHACRCALFLYLASALPCFPVDS